MARTDIAWRGSTEEVVGSAERTSSSASAAMPGYGPAQTLRVQLNITAASGTVPTLDVVVEDTLDGTNWNTLGSFAQKVTTSREVINITSAFADRLRVRWTLGGTTPSFTFAVHMAAE